MKRGMLLVLFFSLIFISLIGGVNGDTAIFYSSNADGNVYLCCHFMGNEEFSYGNLNEKSFEDIWNNPERRRVIDKINLAMCPPVCRNHVINKILFDISKKKKHESFV